MGKLKVFLASSNELQEDRKAFEIAVYRRNRAWYGRGLFLDLEHWEDFDDTVSRQGKQQDYNQAILGCDLFVLLFWTKVGRYTAEEFEVALRQFQATGKPRILVYACTAPPPAPGSENDQASRQAFQARLNDIAHYPTLYANADFLTKHFIDQLDQLDAKGLFQAIAEAREAGVAVPFQAPPPDADHVPRAELDALRRCLLDDAGLLRAVTVGLHGFGGAGKTTLARLLCADAQVRAACRDGILWVAVGRNPPEARAQIADLVVALTGSDEGCLTLSGARARLQAALAGRRLLLVIDDVWDAAQVRDLVEASAGSARLLTTRNTYALPSNTVPLDLAAMQASDARQLLGSGLPPGLEPRLDALARRLGCWPVLLKLVNRALQQRITFQHTPAPQALERAEAELTRKGVLAFDPRHQVLERDQAVAATIEASLDMLDEEERQRCTELAIFPPDVPVPLAQAAALWGLSGGLAEEEAADLVESRLAPLSLLEYDGAAQALQLHEVFRGYLSTRLADPAALHQRLAASWGDRPQPQQHWAWRWLAFHRAAAVTASPPPLRLVPARALVALVSDPDWQQRHETVLSDLPALRQALAAALGAATAVEEPGGTALVVEAADALRQFDARHAGAAPVLDLARKGDLEGARRRSELLAASLDPHWLQALLLAVAWLAPPGQRVAAQALLAEAQRGLGPEPALHDLLAWVRAELHGEARPVFAAPALPVQASDELIESLIKRVGGEPFNGELLLSVGIDPGARDPDMGRRGLYRAADAGDEEKGTTTQYLAEVDGPWLVAYAATAADMHAATLALIRYLSVYTNYAYAEYRYATLWLLLGQVLRLPRPDVAGAWWVQEAVVRILGAALGGGSVEFEHGLPIAVRALRARCGDAAALQALRAEAEQLNAKAARMSAGRDRASGDVWAHVKRTLMAHAQALGWLLAERERAQGLLDATASIADSGFAGYQAPACLALAEAIHVVHEGGPTPAVETALAAAQRAAHNVQDLSFCSRITARVNAMRRHWWTPYPLEARARQLGDGVPRPEFAALHFVGHGYDERRPDALRWPAWAADDTSFAALARRFQRSKEDFLRLNGPERPLAPGEEVAVPDPGFLPHLAARLAAEVLALAGHLPLTPQRLQLLRALVPHAVPSPTALDAVLTRLVLAQGRREVEPTMADVEALEAILAGRAAATPTDSSVELVANRLPA